MTKRYVVVTLIAVISAELTVDIGRKLIEYKIIPEAIKYPPKHMCRVFYRHGEMQPGDVVNYTQVVHAPLVTWPTEPDTNYLLYLYGVNRFSQFKTARYIFNISTFPPDPINVFTCWAVKDIPGDDIMKGKTLVYYIGPPPALCRGSRERYVFLVYKQPQKILPIQMNKFGEPGTRQVTYPDILNLTRLECFYKLGEVPWAANFITMGN